MATNDYRARSGHRLESSSRREFLHKVAAGGCVAACCGWPDGADGAEQAPLSKRPKAPDHSLVSISGTPKERGVAYGSRFAKQIRWTLDDHIIGPYAKGNRPLDKLRRYADACYKSISCHCQEVAQEFEGMAEGSGLRIEDLVLITLHEELGKGGKLPHIGHCTAMAAGPPATCDGNTYCGQSWDWFGPFWGKSQMLRWERKEGPSVLAYSYPGMWVGAGLNSEGVALNWTSGGTWGSGSKTIGGPVVGIPSYALIAHMLYQPSIEAAVEEARRLPQAGWFVFVLADGNGKLYNVEGSPQKITIKQYKGTLARVYYGTHEMTDTPLDQPVKFHPQAQRMKELLEGSEGKLDEKVLLSFWGDHKSTICKHFGTLDNMLFNTTKREAIVSRGPGCWAQAHWQRFTFDTPAAT